MKNTTYISLLALLAALVRAGPSFYPHDTLDFVAREEDTTDVVKPLVRHAALSSLGANEAIVGRAEDFGRFMAPYHRRSYERSQSDHETILARAVLDAIVEARQAVAVGPLSRRGGGCSRGGCLRVKEPSTPSSYGENDPSHVTGLHGSHRTASPARTSGAHQSPSYHSSQSTVYTEAEDSPKQHSSPAQKADASSVNSHRYDPPSHGTDQKSKSHKR